MLKKIIKNIAMTTLSKKRESSGENNVPSFDTKVRVVKTMDFVQPSTFRGFKRYKLTIYKEPDVADGIECFRNNDKKEHFEIKKGTPIHLIFKEANSFKVMEVFLDNHKVGVMYDSSAQYEELVSKSFDQVYIRIEEKEPPYIPGIDVYMFVHYAM